MSKLLWKPTEEQITSSNMYRFMNFVNEKYGQECDGFTSLYEWSIENIPDFWAAMWEFGGIIASKPYDSVIDDVSKMPGAKWFAGCTSQFCRKSIAVSRRSRGPDI